MSESTSCLLHRQNQDALAVGGDVWLVRRGVTFCRYEDLRGHRPARSTNPSVLPPSHADVRGKSRASHFFYSMKSRADQDRLDRR